VAIVPPMSMPRRSRALPYLIAFAVLSVAYAVLQWNVLPWVPEFAKPPRERVVPSSMVVVAAATTIVSLMWIAAAAVALWIVHANFAYESGRSRWPTWWAVLGCAIPIYVLFHAWWIVREMQATYAGRLRHGRGLLIVAFVITIGLRAVFIGVMLVRTGVFWSTDIEPTFFDEFIFWSRAILVTDCVGFLCFTVLFVDLDRAIAGVFERGITTSGEVLPGRGVQLVGAACRVCNAPIASRLEGYQCATCDGMQHYRCAEVCPECSNPRRPHAAAPLAFVLTLLGGASAAAQQTENVFLVTLDGLRRQEVFGGADNALIHGDQGVRDILALRRKYWRGDPTARREALMPFFWGVVATQGQVFGDVDANAPCRVTNGHHFSYPGYSELLVGRADPRIDTNAKRPNPNVTVLEWLHARPEFDDRVAAFASWDVFPAIVNATRSGIPVNAGWKPFDVGPDPLELRLLNEMQDSLPRIWDEVRYDTLTWRGARAFLQERRPRVLYLALGETDDFGHDRRYDRYLDGARRGDDILRELWRFARETDGYAGKTTLIVTTDHGRGPSPKDWTDHGKDVPGADGIWIAVLGPDTPASRVRRDVETTQAQVAATVAAAVGLDYAAAVADVAPALPGVFERRR
jgi:hypothetical protein